MEITVRLSESAETINLATSPQDTLDDIRQKLAEQLGKNPEKLYLSRIENGLQVMLNNDFPLSQLQDTPLLVEIAQDEPKLRSNKRGQELQVEPAPEKNWYAIFLEHVTSGNLTNIIKAFEEFNRESVSTMVDDEVDSINMVDERGWTLLHHACHSGHANITNFLISKDACVNIESKDGWTPLLLCAQLGHVDCAQQLLRNHRIQKNRMSMDKGTALHVASKYGKSAIAKLLLENDVAMTIEDQGGNIPLALACQGGHSDLAEMIPTYMGYKMQRGSTDTSSIRQLFTMNAFYTSSLALEDKPTYLVLIPEQGVIDSFDSEEEFQNRADPLRTIKLINIYDIKPTKGEFLGNQNRAYFTIISIGGTFRLYVESEDLRTQFLQRVNDAIDYCQINKIGMEFLPGLMHAPEQHGLYEIQGADQSLGDQNVSLNDFVILEEIGKGSFGKVYKVMKRDTGIVYAMKKLSKEFLIKHKQLKYAIAECKILKNLNHPFIVKLYFAFQTSKNLYMVLEFCPNGDLMNHLSERSRFGESVTAFYIAETILAIEYLHSLDIVYRDLKPENILVDRAGHILLADFGLAKENVNPLNPAMSFCGSPAYLAPELLSKGGSEKSADVYGIGAMIYEFLTGFPPYYSDNINDLFRKIKRGMLQFPRNVKPEAQDLLKKLLNKDPQKRPKTSQIKDHPFFRNINWADLEAKRIRPPRLSSNWTQIDDTNPLIYDSLPEQQIVIDDDMGEEDEITDLVAEFNFAR